MPDKIMFTWVGPRNMMRCSAGCGLVPAPEVYDHMRAFHEPPIENTGELHALEYTAASGAFAECLRCGSIVEANVIGGLARHREWHVAIEQPTPVPLTTMAERDESRVEAARVIQQTLLELGAPDSVADSVSNDPGARMAQWIRERVRSEQRLAVMVDLQTEKLAEALDIDVDNYDDMIYLAVRNRTITDELKDSLDTVRADYARIREVLLDAGMSATLFPESAATWLQDKLIEVGPYVWKPGDPPPPSYVRVLRDKAAYTGHPYLCRVENTDTWCWCPKPFHAYSGTGVVWETQTESFKRPLTQVPGGDL